MVGGAHHHRWVERSAGPPRWPTQVDDGAGRGEALSRPRRRGVSRLGRRPLNLPASRPLKPCRPARRTIPPGPIAGHRVRPHHGQPVLRSERILQDVNPAVQNGGHVEPEHHGPGAQAVAMLPQPAGGQPADPGLLRRADRLRGCTESGSRAGLHLAEDDRPAEANDEIQLALPGSASCGPGPRTRRSRYQAAARSSPEAPRARRCCAPAEPGMTTAPSREVPPR